MSLLLFARSLPKRTLTWLFHTAGVNPESQRLQRSLYRSVTWLASATTNKAKSRCVSHTTTFTLCNRPSEPGFRTINTRKRLFLFKQKIPHGRCIIHSCSFKKRQIPGLLDPRGKLKKSRKNGHPRPSCRAAKTGPSSTKTTQKWHRCSPLHGLQPVRVHIRLICLHMNMNKWSLVQTSINDSVLICP